MAPCQDDRWHSRTQRPSYIKKILVKDRAWIGFVSPPSRTAVLLASQLVLINPDRVPLMASVSHMGMKHL